MHPSPLAFFFPYWGVFATTRRSSDDRPDGEAAASAVAGQFQRALEIDPMRAAEITRVWREAPR
jgi:hypothetical protein